MSKTDKSEQSIVSGDGSTNIQVAGNYYPPQEIQKKSLLINPTQEERISYDPVARDLLRNIGMKFFSLSDVNPTKWRNIWGNPINNISFTDLEKVPNNPPKSLISYVALCVGFVNYFECKVRFLGEYRTLKVPINNKSRVG